MSLRVATLMAGIMLATPAAVFAAPPAPIVEKSRTPQPAPAAETASYAERETQDEQVADYQGGQTVVIALSGGALVVLLILLLLL